VREKIGRHQILRKWRLARRYGGRFSSRPTLQQRQSLPLERQRLRPHRLRLALGAEIPPNVELYEFAPLLVDQVPKLRDLRFVVSQDQLVIVDPRDRGIALVLDR
jgi:hypothetical protein